MATKKTSRTQPGKINFAVGGQAIIEGVMMRSPHFYVMAVRKMAIPSKSTSSRAKSAPAKGEIIVERRQYISLTRRSKFWALPLLRGMAVLYESLLLGMKALMFSNDIMMQGFDEAEKAAKEAKSKKSGAKSGGRDSTSRKNASRGASESRATAKSAPRSKSKTHTTKKGQEPLWKRILSGLFMVAYFVFVFAFAMFLFKFLPLLAAETASEYSEEVASHYALFNLIDGLTKIVVFLLYLSLISLLPDIRRVFAYHGAEHQAIWAYEKGQKLTIKNAQAEHPEHPRCGTSFIILVLLLSILVYTAVPPHEDFWIKLLQRISLLPVLAGLSYEVLRISAKYETKWWMHWVTLPGIWLQKITTRKPDDDMEEVAIAALKEALAAEKDYAKGKGN